MTFDVIQASNSLEDLLSYDVSNEFPDVFDKTKHIDRYGCLKQKFSDYPVELGAMKATIEDWIEKLKEANKHEEVLVREDQINRILEEDPIIFLNRHDGSHTKKVMEKALDILKTFDRIELSGYEIYFLLCSIVVHDIGNIYGRANHEKKISDILDTECSEIIPDSIERRIISRIAGVHGGKIYGSSDTIKNLKETTIVNNFTIKEQLLAAILRFSDELADDSTRANHSALESGIINDASEIYHVYSDKLHTVNLQKNRISNAYEIFLAFQFDAATAQKLYGIDGHKKYLIDEIYSRTIKMERERRYCMRYLRPYCSLIRINVEITVTIDTFNEERISYVLEEVGYPAIPFTTIKDVNKDILSGKELVEKLTGGIE